MSTMLNTINVKVAILSVILGLRKQIEILENTFKKESNKISAEKAKRVAELNQIVAKAKNKDKVVSTPNYIKVFNEIIGYNSEIDRLTNKYHDDLKELKSKLNKELDNVVSDDMYYIGYISRLYNLNDNDNFVYKKKEYTIPYFENTDIKMNIDLYFKLVLKDLGFERVFTADDKPYKRFQTFVIPFLPSKKNSDCIKEVGKYKYKELVIMVIVRYLLNTNLFKYNDDETELVRM